VRSDFVWLIIQVKMRGHFCVQRIDAKFFLFPFSLSLSLSLSLNCENIPPEAPAAFSIAITISRGN